jgi:integrase
MSVFRVKNSPYYQFDFQLKSHRFYGSTQASNEREAREVEKAKRAEAQRLLEESVRSRSKPMTIGVACDRWWQEVGQHDNDPDIERALNWLKEQIGPNVALHDINDNVVSEAKEARRKHVIRAGRDSNGIQLHRPISARTVNKTVPSLLRRVMNKARKAWSVTIFKEPNWSEHFIEERKRPVREITIEEDGRLDEVESREYAELREFGEAMGLRRRALILTWPQVDFNAATITIIRKGGEPQVLPLSQRVYEILWGLRGNDRVHVFTFIAQRTRRCPKTGIEFVKGKRYPMTYYGIGTNWRRKREKAGIDARLHDMRHTAGQRTLRATGNLKLVQTLLGHTEITTTAKFYTDTTMTDLRDGLNRTESQKKSQIESGTGRKALKDKA